MLTGQQYLASLDDDRATYFEGRRIKDLLAEPAFATPARAIAAGYDRCYSPEPGATNPLVLAPRSPAELRERASVIGEMDLALNVTYQSLMTLLTAAARLTGVDPVYRDRLQAYVDDAIAADIRIAECITDAKGNRSLSPSRQTDPDAYVHVIERRPDGVVIRGAKLHISAASLCHDLLVMPTKAMKPGEEDYAITCAVPVGSPGVSVINTTYHPKGDDVRHYPVSSQVSMPDGFVVFDDVFVPADRVFLDGETANAAVFAHSLGLWERLGGTTAMVRHLHDIAGGSVLTAPSIADLENPDTGGYVEKYMGTGTELTAEDRLRLFHTIRDLTADAFGGWHLVTNLQSGGGLFAQRIVTRRHYDMARATRYARQAAGITPPPAIQPGND